MTITHGLRGITTGLPTPANPCVKCILIGLVLFLLAYWNLGTEEASQTPGQGGSAAAVPTTNARAIGISEDETETGAAVTSLVRLDSPLQFRGALALKSETIVYCPIQKVACTEWLKVFRWIDGQNNWEEPRHIKHGLDLLQKMDVKRGNYILNSPKWLKFAVVREPAERLLSCFLQKCIRHNMQAEYENCPYLELWPDLFGVERFPKGIPREHNADTLDVVMEAFQGRGKDEMFASYVDSITRMVKASPCEQNPHWSPQFCHCSLDLTASVFHIVGWHNMTEAAAAAIVPAVSSPQRGSEIATFLEERMKTNHEDQGKKTSAGRAPQEAYSAEMLLAVHEAYAKDYELFSQYWG